MKRRSGFLYLLLFGAFPLVGVAQTVAVATADHGGRGTRFELSVGDFSGGLGPGGVPEGWQLVRHAGIPRLRAARDGAIPAIEMSCARASFGLRRKLAVDIGAYPRLSWKWRVDKLPMGGDFRSARADDQAAQLYVAFPGMRAIGYLWETESPEGTSGDAIGIPPFARVKVIVLRSGKADTGRWMTEERDLNADYRRLFGEAPPGLKAIGMQIYINSQHTGTDAACAFADIAFLN